MYEDILEKTMRPYALRFVGRAFVFQQDNDPKHTSKYIKEWFDRRRVTIIDWLSQSPDLNIIEHLWDTLGLRLVGRYASNVGQNFAQLREEWNKIPRECIDTLIDSMPRRCQAVIDVKGYTTKY